MNFAVTEACARPYTLAMWPPLRVRGQPVARRTGVVIALRLGNGCIGLGDCAPWPGFGGSHEDFLRPESARALANLWHAFVDAHVAEQSFNQCLDGILQGPQDDEARAAAVAAVIALSARAPQALQAAAQTCLLDVLSQHWHLPMARLLAPHPASSVQVHALVNSAWQAQNARADGYATLKIKVGQRALSEELGTLCAIRAAVGPDVALRLDANGAWPVSVAIQALRLFASVSPAWIEQPVHASDLAGLKTCRDLAITKVAADEAIVDETSLRAVVAQGAADGVVLKPAFLGGPARAVALGAAAQQSGLHTTVTHALEGSVGRAMALQVALALSVTAPCGLGGALPQDPVGGMEPKNGVLTAPSTGGLGLDAVPWLHDAAWKFCR